MKRRSPSDDAKLRFAMKLNEVSQSRFALTHMALKWWERNEGRPAIIYGPQRKGKSSYAIQVILDMLQATGNTWNYRDLVVYHPSQFLQKLSDLTDKGERAPALLWDDAGVWLFALDWNTTFVKAVAKVLQVSATAVCLLLFTTPTPSMIIKRVRDIEGILFAKIVQPHSHMPTVRRARIYRLTANPLGFRTAKLIAEDHYDVMLPDEIYNWYFPLRQSYLREATRLAFSKLEELLGPEAQAAHEAEPPEEIINKLIMMADKQAKKSPEKPDDRKSAILSVPGG